MPGLEARPHAWPKLWKHHAAQEQAERITAVAGERGEAWLPRYGGRISSEWQFAKALQVLEEDPLVYAETARWIEAADWIVWQLCGVETRNTCTAGYKGIYQDGRYPSDDYLAALNEEFRGFVRDKLEHPLSPLGGRAGGLTAQAAVWTGLPAGIAVAVGNVDAHVTAPAARAVEPGHMLAVMGTSTCHIMNGDTLAEVPGMCGVVDGGVVPGLFGYEAGQSGVGDILGWFVEHQVPPSYHDEARRRDMDIHELLSALAAEQSVGQHGLVALDWHSGNRSVLVDHELSGLLVGATLATRAEDIYRALDRGDGLRRPDDRRDVRALRRPCRGVHGRGRAPQERSSSCRSTPTSCSGRSTSPSRPRRPRSDRRCMRQSPPARTPTSSAAAEAMGNARRDAYLPDETRADAYDELFAHYTALHDHFGRTPELMHALRRVGQRAPTTA